MSGQVSDPLGLKNTIDGVSFLTFFFLAPKVMLSLTVLLVSSGRNIFLHRWAMFESSVAALPPVVDQLSQDQLTHHSLGLYGYPCE